MAVKMYEGDSVAFKKACDDAKVKPTMRQFKKFKKGEGSAYAAFKKKD